MMTLAFNVSSAVLALAIAVALVRLARGPTVLDRILAFDLIATCAVAFVVLLSARWKTGLYLELVLIFSGLGFFGTVAFVYYLSRIQRLERLGKESGSGGAPSSSEDLRSWK